MNFLHENAIKISPEIERRKERENRNGETDADVGRVDQQLMPYVAVKYKKSTWVELYWVMIQYRTIQFSFWKQKNGTLG